MILAAAIKYYISATDKCCVLCGARHGDIFKQLDLLGFTPRKGYVEVAQGFITHTGEFLSRYAAYDHAVSCGQLPEKIRFEREMDGNRELISEDLW